ncbi:cell division protein FtsZ [bacterium BMS3Abin01]|nr:cell division protein FtsZ [bacterium BMS3Abin01]HDY69746.1 cell division protein FtsZ [Actinomycetota bacterium]
MKEGALSNLFRPTEHISEDTTIEEKRPAPRGGPAARAETAYIASIKVVGVGGGGTNAVKRMIDAGIMGVEFIAVNTDAQALQACEVDVKIHVGGELTRGLGGGADPNVGIEAMERSRDEVKQVLRGADLVFITAGEGGGTGTGAAPVIAGLAREVGALTIGIVTRPFSFEGTRRNIQAEEGIRRLREEADTVIIVPNDRLLQVVNKETSLLEAFSLADDVLRQGVQSICDLINLTGLINLDFADVRTIMSGAGSALMGVGDASGENRATEAARAAIGSPLLETSIDGARGILLNIRGGSDVALHEANEAAGIVAAAAAEDANIIFGTTVDEDLGDTLRVTVIATGFDRDTEARRRQPEKRSRETLDAPGLPED